MPPRSSRKRPFEEFPSHASVEIVTLSRDDGRISKKRVIEKALFDPPAPSVASDVPELNDLAGENSSPMEDPKYRSRPVSVSVLLSQRSAQSLMTPLSRDSRNGCCTSKNTLMNCFVLRLSFRATLTRFVTPVRRTACSVVRIVLEAG